MKLHYLEIVTPDQEGVCSLYESLYSVTLSSPEEVLGGAKTCTLPDGSILGVRSPMTDTESPIVRPYWLVENLDSELQKIAEAGGEIAHPALELPGKGRFAIVIHGSINHGLWQL